MCLMSIPFYAWSLFDYKSPPDADLQSQKKNKEIHMHLIYELMGYRFNQHIINIQTMKTSYGRT
jgi:hypothetical protein